MILKVVLCVCGNEGQTHGPLQATAPLLNHTVHGFPAKAVTGLLLYTSPSAGQSVSSHPLLLWDKIRILLSGGSIQPALSSLPWAPISCLWWSSFSQPSYSPSPHQLSALTDGRVRGQGVSCIKCSIIQVTRHTVGVLSPPPPVH